MYLLYCVVLLKEFTAYSLQTSESNLSLSSEITLMTSASSCKLPNSHPQPIGSCISSFLAVELYPKQGVPHDNPSARVKPKVSAFERDSTASALVYNAVNSDMLSVLLIPRILLGSALICSCFNPTRNITQSSGINFDNFK